MTPDPLLLFACACLAVCCVACIGVHVMVTQAKKLGHF